MKYIIFAPEFHPIPGGIAEYTFQLAKAFFRAGKLRFLFTNQHQKKKYSFPISHSLSDWNQRPHEGLPTSIRKSFSLAHNFYIKAFIFYHVLKIRLFHSSDTVLLNSLFISLSWSIVPFLNFFNIKYALLLHGLDIIEKKDNNKFPLIQIIEGATELIINSNATKAFLENELPSVRLPQITVIHPPFDKNQFSETTPIPDQQLFKNQLPFSLENKKVICTVCRLVERKGVSYAIASLSTILKERADWVYLIAGDGSEKVKLERLIKRNNLGGQVFLLGNITAQEKHSLLSKSEVFVMPNHTLQQKDFEGFGISFVEAQFFRNVVIGGESGGVIEAVAQNESGFLVNFDNSKNATLEISQYFKLLLGNDSLRTQMGKKGHQYVMRNFEVEQLVSRLKKN